MGSEMCIRDRILSAADTPNAAETRHGIILRTQCQAASDDEIADDVDAMLAVCDQVLSDVGTEVEKLLDGDGPHDLHGAIGSRTRCVTAIWMIT